MPVRSKTPARSPTTFSHWQSLRHRPRQEEWLTYHRWAKEYGIYERFPLTICAGDLVYVSTLATSILYVNSHEMVQEIF